MPAPSDHLPLQQTLSPGDAEEVVALVRQACAAATPLYPIGGGTSLHYGLRAKTPGWGVSLGKLARVVDYPARDMTITVEAGTTMQQLATILAAEGQRLPVDVPQPAVATLGGVIATNWNGPRRHGQGALRDYVIGIEAVDGNGLRFHGGGRVVKNVAGYDFCKLLAGSLGTLGIITQVTLKVRPIPERSAWLACAIDSTTQAETLLAALQHSPIAPAAVELLGGPWWQNRPEFAELQLASGSLVLLVLVEGTATEVAWMKEQLRREWRDAGLANLTMQDGCDAPWPQVIEFSADVDTPVMIQASVTPSGVVPMVEVCRRLDPQCSVLSHAGNGTVFVRFAEFPGKGLAAVVLGELQPAAARHHGHVVILNSPPGAELTHQTAWGGSAPIALMTAVKRKFDPQDLLNRGRFVYA